MLPIASQLNSEADSTFLTNDQTLFHKQISCNPLDEKMTLIAKKTFNEADSQINTQYEPSLQEKLVNQGFLFLANQLERQQGHPWDEIRSINCPLLMQQLLDIYLYKNTNAMEIALKIAKQGVDSFLECPINEEIKKTITNLGKILYLLKEKPEFFSGLSEKNFNDSIDETFNLLMSKICASLRKHYKSHKKTKLQSPKIALRTGLTTEIAKILITDHGSINFGIIDFLFETFKENEKFSFSFETNLVNGLKNLQKSPKLREKFKEISKPLQENCPSNDVIRLTVGLPPDWPVTDLNARQAALTAIFSHIRQGKIGSCFATYLAIDILASKLDLCLKDLTEILGRGKLSRQIKGNRMDFRFLLRMNYHDLEKSFKVDPTGKIILEKGTGKYLWKVPGIISGAKYMGITHLKTKILKILKESSKEKIEITPRNLFFKLSNDREKVSLGCFAFEAQTHNPLLQVWENTIAGMAESEESSMIKSAILNSVIYVLQKKTPKEMRNKFLPHLREKLIDHIQLQYDPDFKTGAFILVDRLNHASLIDNPQKFQLFLDKILQQIECKIPEINAYILKKSFLKKLLIHYHPSNIHLHKNSNFETIAFTPWINVTAHQSKAVLRTYFEEEQELETEKLIPNNSFELLLKIIEIVKKIPESARRSYSENPHKLIPIIASELHSFSLIPGLFLSHASLTNVWESKDQIETWIKNTIIKKGKKIAHSSANDQIKKALYNLIYQESIIAEDQLINFFEEIPEDISLKNLRNTLINLLSSIPNLKKLNKIGLKIDTLISQNLDKNLKEQFQKLILRFADTNWTNGIHDIHFCFLVNPGNGKLEIWKTTADGLSFNAIDQSKWLKNQWEFIDYKLFISQEND